MWKPIVSLGKWSTNDGFSWFLFTSLLVENLNKGGNHGNQIGPIHPSLILITLRQIQQKAWSLSHTMWRAFMKGFLSLAVLGDLRSTLQRYVQIVLELHKNTLLKTEQAYVSSPPPGQTVNHNTAIVTCRFLYDFSTDIYKSERHIHRHPRQFI